MHSVSHEHYLPACDVDWVRRQVDVGVMLASNAAHRLVTRDLIVNAAFAGYSGVMRRCDSDR
jgi:hypothetical protein